MAASSPSRSNAIIEGSKQYPYPSHVNAASFVSVKLLGRTNYEPWQEQLMCLVESHDMRGFIDGTLKNPRENNGCEAKSDVTDSDAMYREWKRSDTLVKGWIFGSLTENAMVTVVGLKTANEVWDTLKKNYLVDPPATICTAMGEESSLNSEMQWKFKPEACPSSASVICNAIGEESSLNVEMVFKPACPSSASSPLSERSICSANEEESSLNVETPRILGKPACPSSASSPRFERLVCKANYKEESSLNVETLPIIPRWIKHDLLVGKICSANEEESSLNVETPQILGKPACPSSASSPRFEHLVCKANYNEESSLNVETLPITPRWIKHDLLVGKPACPISTSTWPISPLSYRVQQSNWGVYVPLCRAIQKGNWEKIENFLKAHKDAEIVEINEAKERSLHIAIGNPDHSVILDKLLRRIDHKLLPELVNDEQETPLHFAARLGNIKAATILVEKNPDLLFTVDKHGRLPILSAIINDHEEPFRFLLEVCHDHIKLSQKKELRNPFEGKHGVLLLDATIFSGLYLLDVAYELLKMYPKLATTKVDNFKAPLYYIARKWDAYQSGEKYNFYQSFVYSHVPAKSYNLENKHNKRNSVKERDMANQNTNVHADLDNKQDIENQETSMANLVTKNYIYQVLEWIYDKLWKGALLHVPHIKHLHDDKVKHNTALKVLEFICEEVGKLESDQKEHYKEAFVVAVENNTPEVLRMITGTFPQSIWSDDTKGHTLSQLSISTRSENAYNFFVHEVTQEKYLHNSCLDKNGDNLLHLAGRLAPQHKLNMVSGAALQMQRELKWFKEVEKIMRPREKVQKNKEKDTPIMVFRKEHETLRQQGENWMKKTADSYTITAALIITIVFAAAITVPGGNKGDTGKPNFETWRSFILFSIADAISFFSSTTSLLLFLSILTARYSEEDFLYKLPKRLILGLVMLFLSMTTMVIAFSTTLYMMFGQEKSWIVIPVVALTCLPVASFVTLQLPLLYDLISSTYGRGIFYKGNKRSVKNSLRYKPVDSTK